MSLATVLRVDFAGPADAGLVPETPFLWSCRALSAAVRSGSGPGVPSGVGKPMALMFMKFCAAESNDHEKEPVT